MRIQYHVHSSGMPKMRNRSKNGQQNMGVCACDDSDQCCILTTVGRQDTITIMDLKKLIMDLAWSVARIIAALLFNHFTAFFFLFSVFLFVVEVQKIRSSARYTARSRCTARRELPPNSGFFCSPQLRRARHYKLWAR